MVTSIGCGGGKKQEEYCELEYGLNGEPPKCRTREEMARDFKLWDGRGTVVSIDDGPRDSYYDANAVRCCYLVTYAGKDW